jgi:hypothetical protein
MSETTTQDTGRSGEASERAEQGIRTMRRTGDIAADAMRRGADAAGEAAKKVEEIQGDVLARARQELGEAGQVIIDNSKHNAEKLRTLLTLPAAAEGGLQDIGHSVVGLVDGVMRTNLSLMEEMLQVKTPRAYVELQQRFIREYLDGLLQGMTLLVRATRRTAEETLRPLERNSHPGARA